MIKYDAGHMGLFFIIRWKGSVFPKALVWAIPNAILAVLLHNFARQEQEFGNDMSMGGVNILWAGYTSVLGFVVVFRNNQAYTRFWEGATLINQVRGEWFNAVSTLFAFCNHGKEFQDKVETFQHTLVRLASMLYCSALQQVCDLEDDTLEIIDNQGMDLESLGFMQDSNDRCEILLQWIQRLIVDSEESKTIKIAPPLLTRAFQELSRGIVNLNNARKIKDIPFPFPYAQMITCMLIVHWATTPVIASQVIESRVAAGVVCFFVTFAFWCLIYIALEIDQPFGEDENDLPLREMQRDFNQSLLNLMHPLAQKVPTYQVPQGPTLKPTLSKSDSTLAGRTTVRVSSNEVALGRGGEIPEHVQTAQNSQAGMRGLNNSRPEGASVHSAESRGILGMFWGGATSEDHRSPSNDVMQDEAAVSLPIEPHVLPLPPGGSGYASESNSSAPPIGPGSGGHRRSGRSGGEDASNAAPRSQRSSTNSKAHRSEELSTGIRASQQSTTSGRGLLQVGTMNTGAGDLDDSGVSSEPPISPYARDGGTPPASSASGLNRW
mmetsp:Transcript_131776/g.320209  ORF Transcript_131776/g.320209 Transcript_131776/m.320209 type:complete len:550 (-) Transcript_131776:47-1696(-)